MNSWLWLLLAIIFEVTGTLWLKASAISSKWLPAVLTTFFYILSFTCLAITLKKIEVGIAYAVWSGLGTVLITVLGILIFGESVSVMKIVCIVLIVIGAVGLNLVSNAHG